MATLSEFQKLIKRVFKEANLVEPVDFQQAFFAALAETSEAVLAVYGGVENIHVSAFLTLVHALGDMAEMMFAASGKWNRTNAAKEKFDETYLMRGEILARQLKADIDKQTAKAFGKEIAQAMMMLLITWVLYVKQAGLDDPLEMLDNILEDWARKHKKVRAQ